VEHNTRLENNNTLLKFTVMIMDNYGLDIMEIGEELVQTGFDKVTDGGFWIWKIKSTKEFYSPLFRESLGYEGEEDFPSTPESWKTTIKKEHLDLAMSNFHSAIEKKDDSIYHQEVIYNKKNGGTIKFIRSGKLLWLGGDFKYILGTHAIKKD
jgi:beta-mannanase